MSSKIRIKVGDIEVEYEGAEEFLKKDLPDLLKTVTQLHPVRQSGGGGSTGSQIKSDIKLTTANIAAKLGCTSGPDLVIAACAHLLFVKNMEAFNRKAILDEMKGAKSYYKTLYRKNLSQSLKALVKHGQLTESSANVYSLHADTIKEINDKLAR